MAGMLASQSLMVETMFQGHRNTEQVLTLLSKACGSLNLGDLGSQCEQLRIDLGATGSLLESLRSASTADPGQALADVTKYAADAIERESQEIKASLRKSLDAGVADLNERFKKLESSVLSDLGSGGGGESSPGPARGRPSETQMLKKVTNRMGDFEAQVNSQLAVMSQDIEKKIAFLGGQRTTAEGDPGAAGMDSYTRDLDSVKYDLGELKDMVASAKTDTAHVKRVVLACERDMEDFTAAMDAVNVDLDEMRARVDSTHSIITSRQRVEATVTAEISTMRLDMGDMQEALKAHDAWMEDVSQSLQEAHERCQQAAEDVADLREQTQAKLDSKTDVSAWNDMNDDIDGSVKTVRDMASSLRMEVDSRRRKVDEALNGIQADLKGLHNKVDTHSEAAQAEREEIARNTAAGFEARAAKAMELESVLNRHAETHNEIQGKVDDHVTRVEARLNIVEAELRKQDEDLHREVNERVDGVEKHHANAAKENAKRFNTLDLRISGLQGASGECKRDVNKLRDEVNNLTVKSAAHDVDIGKNVDDIQKMTRQRAEDSQRIKQDTDAIYEELDQKVYEKTFHGLEENVIKLTRGTVKLCQVVGVFPGARMNDGTEEELDVDVELLNWEDCAQNLTGRVEKTWRQASSQKYRSIMDLLSKKADHSVLRLLQISQQHIEGQLDRVRHEREMWKEVVDKRAQQPMQLALSLKDPHTGQPLAGVSPQFGGGMAIANAPMPHGGFAARDLPPIPQDAAALGGQRPGLAATSTSPPVPGGVDMKAGGPMAKRIGAKPPPPPQRA